MEPKTQEIVIVSLVIVVWIVVMCVFMTKWAKIRVIEPRYFDYKFLLKYDKAFAVRNPVISGTVLNGPRKSIAPSLNALRIGAGGPRASGISAASMRNFDTIVECYDHQVLHVPTQPSRPLLLPLRIQNHRHSHDVRIELSHVTETGEVIETPVSV